MTEREAHVSLLKGMFPNLDLAVISIILETTDNNIEKASDILLDMSVDGGAQVTDTSNPELWPSIKPCPSEPASLARSVNMSTPGPRISKPTSLGNIATAISVSRETDNEAVVKCIQQLQNNQRVLVIMRGLPGSGKSTLAERYKAVFFFTYLFKIFRIVNEAKVGVIFSTDSYFVRNGQYIFRPDELTNAHKDNYEKAVKAVNSKISLIVIDNTNTQSWEMKSYFELGVANGYKMHILEPSTDWRFKPGILANRNSHRVPKHSIEAMLDRYEKNLTVDKLLTLWNLQEREVSDSVENTQEENYVTEIVTSDNESGEENNNIEVADNETVLSLNPDVEEFIPLTVPEMAEQSASLEPEADYEAITEHDEMASLMNIFPALSMEEMTEMYESQTITMSLDPSFATTLQSHFGSPAPPNYLTKLPQDQMLSVDISLSVAKIIFTIWQQSVLTKLNDDKYLVPANSDVRGPPDPPGHPSSCASLPAAPAKTVIARNVVAHYENQMLNSTLEASQNHVQKKRPMIVVKDEASHGSTGDSSETLSNLDIEQLIEERDSLYRKAADTQGAHMRGAASYYAARARELNKIIKTAQKEKQMDMFLTINKGIPKTRIDLHYLQTGEAIKQLQHFVGQWERYLITGQSQSLEIVTGRGNRSERGKSRLRPAVETWLSQKNYHFSEVNDGCFKVTIKTRKK